MSDQGRPMPKKLKDRNRSMMLDTVQNGMQACKNEVLEACLS